MLFYDTIKAPVQMPSCGPDEAPDSQPSHESHADPESCLQCNVFYTDYVLFSSAVAAELEDQMRGMTNAYGESRGS